MVPSKEFEGTNTIRHTAGNKLKIEQSFEKTI